MLGTTQLQMLPVPERHSAEDLQKRRGRAIAPDDVLTAPE